MSRSNDPRYRWDGCGVCKRARGIERTIQQLARFQISSGAVYITWQCIPCGKKPGSAWLSRSAIKAMGIDEASLPLVPAPALDACRKCGALGVEEHHWAPQHLFGDEADQWPIDFLCRPCHKRWHDIVTPRMSRPKDNP